MDFTHISWRLLLAGLTISFLTVPFPVRRAEGAPAQADKTTLTIPLSYFSAFSNYKNYRDQTVLSWPAANDQAGKIGGWRFYAREGQKPDSDGTPPEPGAAAAKPPAGPAADRGHHHDHGSRP